MAFEQDNGAFPDLSPSSVREAADKRRLAKPKPESVREDADVRRQIYDTVGRPSGPTRTVGERNADFTTIQGLTGALDLDYDRLQQGLFQQVTAPARETQRWVEENYDPKLGWKAKVVNSVIDSPAMGALETALVGLNVLLTFTSSTAKLITDQVFHIPKFGPWQAEGLGVEVESPKEDLAEWWGHMKEGYTFGEVLHDYGIGVNDPEKGREADKWEDWAGIALGFAGDVYGDPLNAIRLVGKTAKLGAALARGQADDVAAEAVRRAILKGVGGEQALVDSVLDGTEVLSRSKLGAVAQTIWSSGDDVTSAAPKYLSKSDDGRWFIDLAEMQGVSGPAFENFIVEIPQALVDDIAVVYKGGASAIRTGITSVSDDQYKMAAKYWHLFGMDEGGRFVDDVWRKGGRHTGKAFYDSAEEAAEAALTAGISIKGSSKLQRLLFNRGTVGRTGFKYGRITSKTPAVGWMVRGMPQFFRKVTFGKSGYGSKLPTSIFGWLRRTGRLMDARKTLKHTTSAVEVHAMKATLHAAARGDAMGRTVKLELLRATEPFMKSVGGSGHDGSVVYHALAGDEDAIAIIGDELYHEGVAVMRNLRAIANGHAGMDFLGEVDHYVPRILSDDARNYLDGKGSGLVQGRHRIRSYEPSGFEKARKYISSIEFNKRIDDLTKQGHSVEEAERLVAESGVSGSFLGMALYAPGETNALGEVVTESVENQIADQMYRLNISYALFDDDIGRSLSTYIEAISARTGEVFFETLMTEKGVFFERSAQFVNIPDSTLTKSIVAVRNAHQATERATAKIGQAMEEFVTTSGEEADMIAGQIEELQKVLDVANKRFERAVADYNVQVDLLADLESEALKVDVQIEAVRSKIEALSVGKGSGATFESLVGMEQERRILEDQLQDLVSNAPRLKYHLRRLQTATGVILDMESASKGIFGSSDVHLAVDDVLRGFDGQQDFGEFFASLVGSHPSVSEVDGVPVLTVGDRTFNQTQLETSMLAVRKVLDRAETTSWGSWAAAESLLEDEPLVTAMQQFAFTRRKLNSEIDEALLVVREHADIVGDDLILGDIPSPENVFAAGEFIAEAHRKAWGQVATDGSKQQRSRTLLKYFGDMQKVRATPEYQQALLTYYGVRGTDEMEQAFVDGDELGKFVDAATEKLKVRRMELESGLKAAELFAFPMGDRYNGLDPDGIGGIAKYVELLRYKHIIEDGGSTMAVPFGDPLPSIDDLLTNGQILDGSSAAKRFGLINQVEHSAEPVVGGTNVGLKIRLKSPNGETNTYFVKLYRQVDDNVMPVHGAAHGAEQRVASELTADLLYRELHILQGGDGSAAPAGSLSRASVSLSEILGKEFGIPLLDESGGFWKITPWSDGFQQMPLSVDATRVVRVRMVDGTYSLVTRAEIEKLQLAGKILPDETVSVVDLIREQSALDILVGNNDFLGYEGDNFGINIFTGQPIRLDNGAVFHYRAQGKLRERSGYKYGEVSEILGDATFLDPQYNNNANVTGLWQAISDSYDEQGASLVGGIANQFNLLLGMRSKYGGWEAIVRRAVPDLHESDVRVLVDFLDTRARRLAQEMGVLYPEGRNLLRDSLARANVDPDLIEEIVMSAHSGVQQTAKRKGYPAWTSPDGESQAIDWLTTDDVLGLSVSGQPTAYAREQALAMSIRNNRVRVERWLKGPAVADPSDPLINAVLFAGSPEDLALVAAIKQLGVSPHITKIAEDVTADSLAADLFGVPNEALYEYFEESGLVPFRHLMEPEYSQKHPFFGTKSVVEPSVYVPPEKWSQLDLGVSSDVQSLELLEDGVAAADEMMDLVMQPNWQEQEVGQYVADTATGPTLAPLANLAVQGDLVASIVGLEPNAASAYKKWFNGLLLRMQVALQGGTPENAKEVVDGFTNAFDVWLHEVMRAAGRGTDSKAPKLAEAAELIDYKNSFFEWFDSYINNGLEYGLDGTKAAASVDKLTAGVSKRVEVWDAAFESMGAYHRDALKDVLAKGQYRLLKTGTADNPLEFIIDDIIDDLKMWNDQVTWSMQQPTQFFQQVGREVPDGWKMNPLLIDHAGEEARLLIDDLEKLATAVMAEEPVRVPDVSDALSTSMAEAIASAEDALDRENLDPAYWEAALSASGLDADAGFDAETGFSTGSPLRESLREVIRGAEIPPQSGTDIKRIVQKALSMSDEGHLSAADFLKRIAAGEQVPWDSRSGNYGVVVVDPKSQGDNLLLRMPTDGPPSGKPFGGLEWTFPKGGIDEGETPMEAAIRETYEETGMRVEIVGVLPKPPAGDTSQTFYFIGRPVAGETVYSRTLSAENIDEQKLLSLTHATHEQNQHRIIDPIGIVGSQKGDWNDGAYINTSAVTTNYDYTQGRPVNHRLDINLRRGRKSIKTYGIAPLFVDDVAKSSVALARETEDSVLIDAAVGALTEAANLSEVGGRDTYAALRDMHWDMLERVMNADPEILKSLHLQVQQMLETGAIQPEIATKMDRALSLIDLTETLAHKGSPTYNSLSFRDRMTFLGFLELGTDLYEFEGETLGMLAGQHQFNADGISKYVTQGNIRVRYLPERELERYSLNFIDVVSASPTSEADVMVGYSARMRLEQSSVLLGETANGHNDGIHPEYFDLISMMKILAGFSEQGKDPLSSLTRNIILGKASYRTKAVDTLGADEQVLSNVQRLWARFFETYKQSLTADGYDVAVWANPEGASFFNQNLADTRDTRFPNYLLINPRAVTTPKKANIGKWDRQKGGFGKSPIDGVPIEDVPFAESEAERILRATTDIGQDIRGNWSDTGLDPVGEPQIITPRRGMTTTADGTVLQYTVPDKSWGGFARGQQWIDEYEAAAENAISGGAFTPQQGDTLETLQFEAAELVQERTRLGEEIDELNYAINSMIAETDYDSTDLAMLKGEMFALKNDHTTIATRVKAVERGQAALERMGIIHKDGSEIPLTTLTEQQRDIKTAVGILDLTTRDELRLVHEALQDGVDAAEALALATPVGDNPNGWFPLTRWQDREEEFEDLWMSGFRSFGVNAQGPAALVESMTAVTRYRAQGGFGAFMKHYDKLHNLMKGYMIMKPGFHMRNYFSAVFMNYLHGVNTSSYRQFQRAYWQFQHDHAVEQGLTDRALKMRKALKARGIWGQVSADDVAIIRMMQQDGILGGTIGQTAGEFLVAPEVGGRKISFRDVNPFNPANAPLRLSRELGMGTETFVRGVMGFDTIKKGGDSALAFDNIVKYHFDYDDLSDFERNVIKKVIPFYTWTKNALPLMMEQMGRNPAKMNRYWQLKKEIELGQEKPPIVPDYYISQGGIQLPFKYEGENMYILPDLPFKVLFETIDPMLVMDDTSPQDRIRKAMSVLGTQVTPLLKAPYEWHSKQNIWKGYNFDGRYQHVPTVYQKIPLLMQTLDAFGATVKQDDKWLMRDYDLHAMAQLLPTFSDMRRLFPSEERYQQRTLSTWMSFLFGLGLRTNTKAEQEAAYRSKFWTEREEINDMNQLVREAQKEQ